MVAAYQSFAHATATLGNNIIVTKPTGTVDGDLLIAVGLGVSVGAPAGWTTHSASLGTNSPLFTKIASGEGANYTFTQGIAQTSKVVIVRINGQAASSPVDVASGVTGTGALVIPTITSTGANRLLMQIASHHAGGTWSGPGTQTERFDRLDNGSFSAAGGDEIVGSGATGTRTWTPSITGSSGVGYMLAIKSLTTDYTQSADLVGVGVTSRVVEAGIIEPLTGDGVVTRSSVLTMSEDLTGDGVVTRGFAATMSDDLTGDGVVSRAFAVGISEDVTGDGTITETHQQAFVRVFDLVGDGVLTNAKATVAAKTFDLVGDGTVTETHSAGMFRTFDLTGDGVISGSADIPFPNIPECAPDWTPNDGLKSIEGDVFFHEPPNEGDPVIGADVCLIRDSDGLRVECTTTDGTGHYSFARDTNDPYTYHVEVRYLDQQGLSEGGCVPA